MRFEVSILGSSSATPIFNRNPTSQLLNVNERFFLIDAGEGTQLQLLRYGFKAQRIDHIFISHLHGDHYFGLIGLLSSLHLNGRTKPMYIFGPPALQEILEMQFKHSQTILRYPIVFHATDPVVSKLIFENKEVKVETIILDHRIPCTGFKFTQTKRPRRIIKERVEELDIPIDYIPLIKNGLDFTDKNGVLYPASELTTDPERPRSYAYCSDTICSWNYLDQIKGVDTLYHEATFLNDMLARAEDTYHTTALQAGEIAKKAGVNQLLIGHFSARYRDLIPLLEESRSVFTNTQLAVESQTFVI